MKQNVEYKDRAVRSFICISARIVSSKRQEILGFPGDPGKESVCQCRRLRFDPWVGKIPWRRKWQPIPVFLPGEIPSIKEPGGLQSMGSQKSQTWLRA